MVFVLVILNVRFYYSGKIGLFHDWVVAYHLRSLIVEEYYKCSFIVTLTCIWQHNVFFLFQFLFAVRWLTCRCEKTTENHFYFFFIIFYTSVFFSSTRKPNS